MTRPAYGAPDGHGRYGVLDHDDGRVLCHDCGRWMLHLATHARQAHGLSAQDYREAHGLTQGQVLVGEVVRARMTQSWERHRDLHIRQLEEHRDIRAAQQASLPLHRNDARRAQRTASVLAAAAARRTDLTAAQVEELGDITDIAGWSQRVRLLRERDGISLGAVARATGLAAATVAQRLRRHP